MKDHCPRCDSPAPHLHPAVQFEGEVQACSHPFHDIPTNQNPPRVFGKRLNEINAELLAALQDITFRFATVCAATGEFSEANAKALDAASVAMQHALGEA